VQCSAFSAHGGRMKSFIKSLTVVVVTLFTFFYSFRALAQIDECAEPFRQAGLEILEKAMQNGYEKVNSLKLTDLKQSLLSDRIAINCNLTFSFNGDGRRSAMFVTSAGKSNDSGILYNYIFLTQHALTAPIELRGYLLLHEYLGAINKDDTTYAYTTQLYGMVKNPRLSRDQAMSYVLARVAAKGEGTSTGVGGGDWRNLQLKQRLYDMLLLQLRAVSNEDERERRLRFYLTLDIEIGSEKHFAAHDSNIFATIELYENSEMRKCRDGKGLMIILREAYYEPMTKYEENFKYFSDFVFKFVNNSDLGQSAICFKGSRNLLK
jgi:hypothetical protein